jgi:hypothetical protein
MPPLQKQGEEDSLVLIMSESFRGGLSGVIGKSGMEAVFYNFKLKDRLMNPKLPHEALLPAFKERGTEILEKAVMKEVFRRIDSQYVCDGEFFYEEMFHRARRAFVSNQIRE